MDEAPPDGPIPQPPHGPIEQSIKGATASYGSQAVTGVVYGSVTLHNTYAPSVSHPATAAPKPCSTVPFRRDRDFVDRGDLLTQIDQRCSQPAGRVALVGLGGVGKSQIAIEYAHRVRERSPETWVFWVFASNAARVEAAYKEIADRVMLPGRNESAINVIEAVTRWLSGERSGRWIMIIDNIDDVETLHAEVETSNGNDSVASIVPQSDNGAVLVTSRNVDVAREMTGREDDILPIGQMSVLEADELLRRKLRTSPQSDVAELLAELEHFPLAITQAAAFINRQPGMNISKYLARLQAQKSKAAVLAKSLPDARRHEKATSSILRTWQITFDQIRVERADAADLLSFMSFFNRQGIPKFLLRHYSTPGGSHDAGNGAVSCEKEGQEVDEELEEHIAILHSFSLIAIKQTEEEFEMHGLVQMATHVWLRSMGKEEAWWSHFVSVMANSWPIGDYDDWPTCRILQPHVGSVKQRQPVGQKQIEAWTHVLTSAGWYACKQGLLSQAQSLIEMSLDTAERIYGSTDSKTSLIVGRLATVLRDQSRYTEAETLNRRALAGHREVFGEDHLATSVSLDNLALVLLYQGKHDEAEPLTRQALAWFKNRLGDGHEYTLTTAGNLASILHSQKKFAEAEEMNRLALVGCNEKFGACHPRTQTEANNVALLLRDQGKYEEAESMIRSALAANEEKLGKDHLSTLTSASNLALVLRDQGKCAEAEMHYRRALVGREEQLESTHMYTLASMSNLSSVLVDLGRYEEAERLNRRALAGYEERLGGEHPDTLTSVWCLAYLLALLGQYEEAKALYRRVCEGYRDRLGDHHASTIACSAQLADLLLELEKLGD